MGNKDERLSGMTYLVNQLITILDYYERLRAERYSCDIATKVSEEYRRDVVPHH